MEIPEKCSNCFGTKLTWAHSLRNVGPAVDGRIKLNEVVGQICLGCDECSETLVILTADEFLISLQEGM